MNVAGTGTEVCIETGGVRLTGDLHLPEVPLGLVVFAHGSGSSRFSPRNRRVAELLNANRLGTLLVDLLTRAEEDVDRLSRRLRFDIGLLHQRLSGIMDWVSGDPRAGVLDIGCFGASTGAAGALLVAAEKPDLVKAVVSRGGRPDLAAGALPLVKAPTLLIVGGNDPEVLELNRDALERIAADKALEVVAGATHLFEEPGALDEVARLSADWFVQHLGS